MENKRKEILFTEPVYKHTVWGGKRLREEYGCPEEGDDIGECWGISAHPQGDCIIRNGTFKGEHLSKLWEEHGELFGTGKTSVFPLLVKIIDASGDLSIQVHPDDAYAREHENGSLGKTECWYVLDCPEGAELVLGHRAATRKELVGMIDEGRWEEFVKRVPVKKGDFLQIDPGTVHALTSGCLILETQENSDITYRVYDYDRLQNGEKRQLHLEQSKKVITVPALPAGSCIIPLEKRKQDNNELSKIYSCDYYTIYEMRVHGEAFVDMGKDFLLVTITEGFGEIEGTPVSKGSSFIVPSGYGKARFKGNMMLVASTACAACAASSVSAASSARA
ncbi:type I phosphomannose isomerase catalytic subunit [Butyrivibrio sp. FCS014]|uniref:type I phosphomannose isomerase catalytic subunit n=1 Tax=Butyrivibrio sp. FCS014 TaxID=1408304 RepID=UPI00046366F1|nr:type I phosphomannose isomerase catalytic subunit [Butyrivibrio sp. FCS014]